MLRLTYCFRSAHDFGQLEKTFAQFTATCEFREERGLNGPRYANPSALLAADAELAAWWPGAFCGFAQQLPSSPSAAAANEVVGGSAGGGAGPTTPRGSSWNPMDGSRAASLSSGAAPAPAPEPSWLQPGVRIGGGPMQIFRFGFARPAEFLKRFSEERLTEFYLGVCAKAGAALSSATVS